MPVLQNLNSATNTICGRLRVLQGRSMKNGGWPRFNGTYKNYPSLKRKWAMNERTHLQQQSEKEKVQQSWSTA